MLVINRVSFKIIISQILVYTIEFHSLNIKENVLHNQKFQVLKLHCNFSNVSKFDLEFVINWLILELPLVFVSNSFTTEIKELNLILYPLQTNYTFLGYFWTLIFFPFNIFFNFA